VHDSRAGDGRALLVLAGSDHFDAVGGTVAVVVVVHVIRKERLRALHLPKHCRFCRCMDAAGPGPVYLAVWLRVARSVHGGEAVVHLARGVPVLYEAGARGRAVMGGESGLDIARECDASWGRSVCNGRGGSQLLGDGGERLQRDCEGRGRRDNARLVALGRGGEMKDAVAACALPKQL
jgi:hypothetical protein